ncbi:MULTISPECIES: hypothetical protein [Enterococcus]|uniref:Uncharacterized protein n=2 Tax=Enterococcus TaxID=1350 RepID=A0A848MUN1_ENTMU|nr:hypothetical protein [Enterococcus mundtii]MBE9912002.1 hypothetical protein [Enterococcus mundtii]MCA6772745.1 hypothetical protein [Enterococcus mundtii]MRI72447.1 hypothetical protein [Enterococcus mundtii]NMP57678.1 hypothetical protein [Enterococcus mundtii]QCJ56743.1 hypothetical protein DDJ96_09000 [Enterococcus mundtii]
MWLFTKRRKKQQPAVKPNPTIVERDNEKPEKMKPVPAYIDAAPADIQLVSVVAASLAAEYDPESRFIIKKIKQRNPEAILVSLIATGVAAGVNPNSQFIIRKIAKK